MIYFNFLALKNMLKKNCGKKFLTQYKLKKKIKSF